MSESNPLDTEMTRVWRNAPGVKSCMWGWAKASKPKCEDDRVVHAYRLGKGMKTASCNYTFPGSVELPHARDRMCAVCAARVRQVDEMMDLE